MGMEQILILLRVEMASDANRRLKQPLEESTFSFWRLRRSERSELSGENGNIAREKLDVMSRGKRRMLLIFRGATHSPWIGDGKQF